MKIAFIGYMVEQNEPSTPHVGDVREGHLREDLTSLYISHIYHGLDDEDVKNMQINTEEFWGDLRVFPDTGEDVFMFVAFEEEDREKALKELGLEDGL